MQQGGGSEQGGGGSTAIYRGLRGRRGMPAALGEINVTPLVDVVLVLLLVFMITAPMMTRGIDVTLPVADQPQIEPEDRIRVTVDAKRQIFIGQNAVNIMLLEDRLRGMLEGRAARVVYLHADQALRYGDVITVVDRIKRAGVEQIGFAYELPQERAAR